MTQMNKKKCTYAIVKIYILFVGALGTVRKASLRRVVLACFPASAT